MTGELREVPFNRSYVTGTEFGHIREAIENMHLSGNGPFGRRCAEWLVDNVGCAAALLTPSCTAALEMAAILAGIEPGDEVLMPSFTFVSTANAFVLRGAVPVFVDIRPDTLNLDESLLESAITERTKAIVPVHYAGFGCEMERVMAIAGAHDLTVIEDAAHAVLARHDGRALGSIGHMATLSFHETKNVSCGEGGALLVNDPELVSRAEIIQEKGTNRQAFHRGQVDKYTWVDVGSSFLLSDINSAYLYAQLEVAAWMNERRLEVWRAYHEAFEPLEQQGLLRRPATPPGAEHNGHLYYLLLPDGERRGRLIGDLAARGVAAVFHYVPLHSAPAGRRHGRSGSSMEVTDDVSERLLRLPMWVGMTSGDVDHVIASVFASLAPAMNAA